MEHRAAEDGDKDERAQGIFRKKSAGSRIRDHSYHGRRESSRVYRREESAMKFPFVTIAAGLIACAQSTAASQGPGVAPGQAGSIAQALAGAIIGMLAAVVIFGLLKLALGFARPR
jgi:hypothetical protein